jgi:protein-disulfide isomerase
MNRNISIALAAVIVVAGLGYVLWQQSAPHAAPAPSPAPALAQATPPAAAPADPGGLGPRMEGTDMILGAANAPITIIEYASMTCPHCASFHVNTLPQVKANYIDKGLVKFIFREFPLDAMALRASMIARCAGPERYFSFVEVLFRQQDVWAPQRASADQIVANLKRLAKLGGMSEETSDACLKNQDVQNTVLAVALGGERDFNVRSTPTLIINGKAHSGGISYDEIDKVLKPLIKS